MKLSILLEDIYKIPAEFDRDISDLILDSRSVKAGDLFFAYKGVHFDGREYIDDAIAKGAVAVLVESDSTDVTLYGWASLRSAQPTSLQNIPIIPVKKLNFKLSAIAAKFFGNPAKSLRIIGITGTNGKTSCSHFIAATLHQLNITCGVIGTLGSGLYGNIQQGGLTTPDAITLQALFAKFVAQGATVVAMEVSSHSIDQGRVEGIPFEVAVFTNLTRDHLDYHGDMETYGAVKKRLFENNSPRYSVINADDAFGRQMIQGFLPAKNIYAYTVDSAKKINAPTIAASKIELDISGIHALVTTPWGQGQLDASLIGQFNLSNLLAVLTTLCLLDIPLPQALKSFSELHAVHGRMQAIGSEDQPLVVVDYSHTPDALEKALIALRAHCQRELYCVFGCGGERDRGKRPMMAKIAEQYADHVIVTDDNPRHENSDQIMADIATGFQQPAKVIMQHNRSKAIQDVIQCAVRGDCILVAGRGGEIYQYVGDEKIPFDDVEVVKKFLSQLSSLV